MTPTKTTTKKSFHGWVSKSLLLNVKNGQDVELTTCKRSSGEIVSSFQYGKHKDDEKCSSFSYTIFQDENGTLLREKKTATEKSVENQHVKALEIFINSFN